MRTSEHLLSIETIAVFHMQPIKMFRLELNNSPVSAKQIKCPVSGLLQRFSMFNILRHLFTYTYIYLMSTIVYHYCGISLDIAGITQMMDYLQTLLI